MNRRTWLVTALLLVALLAVAAGPLQPAQVRAQTPDARVRFLHAIPGAPDVDVYLDGAIVASGLAFGDVTPHLSVAGGDHQVALRQSGMAATSAALIEVVVPLVPSSGIYAGGTGHAQCG